MSPRNPSFRRHPLVAAALFGLLAAACSDGARADRAEIGGVASSLEGDLFYDSIVAAVPGGDLTFLEAYQRPVRHYRQLGMARVFLSVQEAEEVAARPEVLSVRKNRLGRLLNAEGRSMMRVDQVQAQGYTGAGVEVAVIDTGIDQTHADLFDRTVKNWVVMGEESYDALFLLNLDAETGALVSVTPDGIDVHTRVVDVSSEAGGMAVNSDDHGHGTHVAGTIAGTGAESEGYLRGMAPGARIHSYDVHLDGVTMFPFEAFDHILEQNLSGQADIRVVNNSWGPLEPGCTFDPFDPGHLASRRLFEAGVLVEFSYGNSGPEAATCNILTTAPWILGVGATSKSFGMAAFSSRGHPNGNHDRDLALANFEAYLGASAEERAGWDFIARPIGLFRPSVVAPGEGIVSAQNPFHQMTLTGTPYGSASGTSMSGPMASGVAALVIGAYEQAHPGQRLSPLDVIRLLEVTANRKVMFGYEAFEAGAGFIDAEAAVSRAVSGDLPTTVTADHLVRFDPGPNSEQLTGELSGTVLVNSWQTNVGYVVHDITVPERALRVKAEVGWATELDKVYLRLFAPGVDPVSGTPAATSGSLITITKRRTIEVLFPQAGTWKLRADGRLNAAATSYTGASEVWFTVNGPPTAQLDVTPERVTEDRLADLRATIADVDGAADVSTASLVVRDRHGRLRGSFDRSHFQVSGDTTLSLEVLGFALEGPAPWTFQLRATDSHGHQAFADDFIGRK